MSSDQSTLFAGDSHASRGVQPGSSEAMKMTVTSGLKCYELLRLSGLDGSLAKMYEALFRSPWGSTVAFLTWKILATPSNRALPALSVSLPRTEGTESGLWPTANATDWKGASQPVGRRPACDDDLPSRVSRVMMPTPSVAAATQGQAEPDGKRGQTLVGAARGQMWPTPHGMSKDGKSNGPSGNELGCAVNRSLYPTMDLGAAKGRGQASADKRHRLGGSLNPAWVCWLMGYPLDWLDIDGPTNPKASPASRSASKTGSPNSGA